MLLTPGREYQASSVRRPRGREVDGAVASTGTKALRAKATDSQYVDRSRRIEHEFGAIGRPLKILRTQISAQKMRPEVPSGPKSEDVDAVELRGSPDRRDRVGEPCAIARPRDAQDVATPIGIVFASDERAQATPHHGREVVPTWPPRAVVRRTADHRELPRSCDGCYSGPHAALPTADRTFASGCRPLRTASVPPPEDGDRTRGCEQRGGRVPEPSSTCASACFLDQRFQVVGNAATRRLRRGSDRHLPITLL